MPDVHESQPRRTPQRHNDRMGQPVQAGMRSRQRLIDRVPGCKILRAVQPPAPRHASFFGRLAVDVPHTAALPAAQLLHRQMGDVLLRKAQLVHFAHHIQMLPVIADQFRLTDEHPGMGGQRAAVGIIAHAVLPDPDRTHAGVSHQLHSTVGHTGAGAEQQHRNARRRDLNDTLFIRYGNRTVLTAQRAVFQVQKGHPVPDLRQRLQIRADHARHIIHGCFLRAGWSSGQGRRLCRGQCPDTASPGTLPGRSPAGCPHRSPPAM